MELNKIENRLEKYFQGETSVAEENELKAYFSSPNVAQHLKQYQSIFGYFSQEKEQKMTQEIPLQTKKRNVTWLSIVASIVFLLGIGSFYYLSNNSTNAVVAKSELGTYNNPEEAFVATQKALALLSNNVNAGIESVHYIKEYEQSKNKIFKQ
ncbi:hypothetical protein DMB65_15590 [Flavobacterium cheongpyeongense]|jgi:hypothetical protein|uniref:Uncharacterized protein n=1 Tax=Flavobacterium cheongpyeongense TaxID=2212651 RepID=A0A2V4BLU6_9FLAO|nr:hypothetical protein [Flavobacterium cheongpyeongense]PXY39935.1 hypothetical protein DMB65_15590 [Flavobacterium cheongpyeongense]